ncbi:MAG TPA: glycoside hydrolase family 30 protein [Armatimonadota bacterium]|nr:glycoside hydrolase family 30 protein [Armatimonadota bacterium]
MIQRFLTCKATEDRLTAQAPVSLTDNGDYTMASVMVDTQQRFQTIEGFGGAFTEAAATTFYKMSPAIQQEILRAYFDPTEGHGYSLCRTHINSCDFSLGNYAYTEVDGDVELKHFSIERDRQALIPMIKAAKALAGTPFKLFASPWSPPAWMKTTGMMNQGGKLKPEYREAWANYYCRYIAEYAQEGIDIWGLTVQNEPEATQSWDSCIYTGAEERDFVRDHLGPALQRHGLADIRLIIWDHNRDRMFERAKAVYDDPEAAKYVWGTGFHWYCGDHFDNVQRVHDAWPDKQLIFTEGCQEWGTHIGSWEVGERYGRSIINDVNRWTVAWTDWNLILDETGGPNHVNNLCSAPIIANTTEGTLYYHSSYYYIGHFSRFIRPGAQRILCASTRDELETTACINPDGTIAVVVMNRSEDDVTFNLRYAGKSYATSSPARSIQTFVIEA